MQANLINIHVPKGKPKVTVEKLRPKGSRRRGRDRDVQDAVDDSELSAVMTEAPADPKEAARAAMQRARDRREGREHAEESTRFWDGPEGRRMKELLGEE
jgi:hypothetical protein